ncbi:hypothetical protein R3P38DRAFT_2796104 [Favolaschia claudopus]|uniref:Uncharacterized protein n=1 Tax=Favolaschia claudopus TaxID=2862362 RepID=A0AAW0A600_9AGAR
MHGLDDANQQDIGELAAHSCPLERLSSDIDPSQSIQPESPYLRQAYKGALYAAKANTVKGLNYLTRELGTQFLQKGPKPRGIRGNNDSVGGNRGQLRKNAPKSREFGATAGIGSNTNSARIFGQETNALNSYSPKQGLIINAT